jgi:hypothetical protein
MGSIVETISGDKRLKLGNEQFVRKLAVGRNWHHLRIGVRLSFNGPAGAVSAPNLAIGLCSGTSNCVGDASTTNFYGITTRSVPSATLNTNPVNSHTFSNFKAQKRVGTTWTDFGDLSVGVITSVPASRRCMIFCDIIDTPSAYIKAYINQNSYFGVADMSLVSFLDLLATQTPPDGNYVYTSKAITLSETAGSLDTVNIMWNNDTYTMEFSDIAVYRFS